MAQVGIYKTKIKNPIVIGLKKIYGVGLGRAKMLHVMLGAWNLQLFRHGLRRDHRKRCNYLVQHRFLIGKIVIKRLRDKNVKRLKRIDSFRGSRHVDYLPARGQRTHSNHCTSRYLIRGTWFFVFTQADTRKVQKKRIKFVRRKKHLVLASNAIFNKLMQRNFIKLKKNKGEFNHLVRSGNWGHFKKFAKANKIKIYTKKKKRKKQKLQIKKKAKKK